MKYVSRRYLEEKWNRVKWDVDALLTSESDDVTEEAERRKLNIVDGLKAIIKEIEG